MRTITAPPSADLARFRVASTSASHPRVDRTNRVLYGVSIIQLGELNAGDARQWYVDQETLRRVHDQGRAKEGGVKARFAHPNMSNDGLGKLLGRHHNFRMGLGGMSVLADLHLAAASSSSPGGDLGKYVMDLAEEDPEAFGISIVSRNDYELMEREKRITDGFEPIRPKYLTAADVVDEPAATRGGVFGSEDFSIATAPHHATAALNLMFAEASPDVIRSRVHAFLEHYLGNRFGAQGHAEGSLASSGPLRFRNGCGLADMSSAESAALMANVGLVNEWLAYREEWGEFAEKSLYTFAVNHLCTASGYTATDELMSALQKQSDHFGMHALMSA